MICSNCGSNNKDGFKFCTKCGAKLELRAFGENPIEKKETMILDEVGSFESDETVIIDDLDAFENDETVIIDDVSVFENDETVILDNDVLSENTDITIPDNTEKPEEYEDEGTVILSDEGGAGYLEKPAGSLPMPKAPAFDYRPVFKEEQRQSMDETAYIDHLRALKGLLDDGIITEEEFTQKKRQILGI